MATAFSQPQQFTPYVENFDKDLVLQTLTYKQGKYDLGRQKIKETIYNATNLDLVKDEDQDYLYNKLQETVDVINQYGSGDLSLDSRTDYLQSYISSIADDKVMNGYMGSMVKKSILTQGEEAKKNGTYSADNMAYSLDAITAWENDGQVGSKYNGGSTYVPYSDNNKKFLEAIKQIEPDAYASVNALGETEYYTRGGILLKKADIKGALDLLISSDPTAAKQMEVNAWSQFRGMDDATFFANAAPTINALQKNQEEDIKSLEKSSLLIKDPNDPRKVELEKLIQYKKDQIKNLTEDRTTLQNFIYKESTLNEYADVYAYTKQTKADISANDAYFKKESLAIEKEKLDIQKSAAGLDLKKEIALALGKGDNKSALYLAKYGVDNNILSPDFSLTPTIGERVIDEATPTGKLTTKENVNTKFSDIGVSLASQYNNINGKVIQALKALSESSDPRFKGKSLVDIYSQNDFSGNRPISQQLPIGVNTQMNLDDAVNFLKSEGGYDNLIKEYETYNEQAINYGKMKEGLFTTIQNDVEAWLDSPQKPSYPKVLGVGNEGVLFLNGQYYPAKYGTSTVGSGYASTSSWERTSTTPMTKEQIITFAKNKSSELGGNVSFNNGEKVVPLETLKDAAYSQYEEKWQPLETTPIKIAIKGGDKATGFEGKQMLAEIASYITNNIDNYSKNSDNAKILVNLMTTPENIDRMVKSKLVPDAKGKNIVVDDNISIKVNPNTNNISLTIGDNVFETPFNVYGPNTVTSYVAGQTSSVANKKKDIETTRINLENNAIKTNGTNKEVLNSKTLNVPPRLLPNNEIAPALNIPIKVNVKTMLPATTGGKFSYLPSIEFTLDGKTQEIDYIQLSNIFEGMSKQDFTSASYTEINNFIADINNDNNLLERVIDSYLINTNQPTLYAIR